jgi:hypothetical protein
LRALMVHYQSNTGKQYSGDSYFREQDFIQTNPHGTLTQILTSCPLATLASQELTQAFPKPHSPCNVFLAVKGSPAKLWEILTADLSCRSSLPVHWQHPVVGRRVALSMSEPREGLWQRSLQRSGGSARVFMLGGDLIVGVICLTTLGLAHLHIGLSFSGLVS